MITVDVNNEAEVYAAGCRLLNENLGLEAARVFMSLSSGGTGDYTAEKKQRKPMSREELESLEAEYAAEADTRGAL